MGVNWPSTALVVNPRRWIELATHKGEHIDNEVGIEPNEDGRRQYEVERTFHGTRWKRRRVACGIYNCWGMLFACRRTGVFENEDVERVLKEEYRRIQFPKQGDIVVYRLRPSRSPAHGGLVWTVTQNSTQVLSKWNIGWGEDVHDVKEVPGLMLAGGFDIEFYTDRPDDSKPHAQLLAIR